MPWMAKAQVPWTCAMTSGPKAMTSGPNHESILMQSPNHCRFSCAAAALHVCCDADHDRVALKMLWWSTCFLHTEPVHLLQIWGPTGHRVQGMLAAGCCSWDAASCIGNFTLCARFDDSTVTSNMLKGADQPYSPCFVGYSLRFGSSGVPATWRGSQLYIVDSDNNVFFASSVYRKALCACEQPPHQC